jgi:tRNA dimethylallyltransferase
MAPRDLEKSVVVIVGPTASGKTTAAIEVARRYGGEIICADSRTIYKGMDVGTAKPTFEEQKNVPHWGLDLVEPTQRYSSAQFQVYAESKIREIKKRGNMPIIVGGTGLYVDGLIFSYQYPQPPNVEQLKLLENMTTEQLHKYCVKNNIELPFNDKNKRHLARAAVTFGASDKRSIAPTRNIIIVGIATEKAELRARIEERTEHMFANGVVEEAIILGKKYGWKSEAMTSNVYRSLNPYLKNEYTINEAKQDFTIRDCQLAKRQMTWFRRNPYIEWCTRDEVVAYLIASLETE